MRSFFAIFTQWLMKHSIEENIGAKTIAKATLQKLLWGIKLNVFFKSFVASYIWLFCSFHLLTSNLTVVFLKCVVSLRRIGLRSQCAQCANCSKIYIGMECTHCRRANAIKLHFFFIRIKYVFPFEVRLSEKCTKTNLLEKLFCFFTKRIINLNAEFGS